MQVYEENKTKQISYLLIIFQQSLFLELITYYSYILGKKFRGKTWKQTSWKTLSDYKL